MSLLRWASAQFPFAPQANHDEIPAHLHEVAVFPSPPLAPAAESVFDSPRVARQQRRSSPNHIARRLTVEDSPTEAKDALKNALARAPKKRHRILTGDLFTFTNQAALHSREKIESVESQDEPARWLLKIYAFADPVPLPGTMARGWTVSATRGPLT